MGITARSKKDRSRDQRRSQSTPGDDANIFHIRPQSRVRAAPRISLLSRKLDVDDTPKNSEIRLDRDSRWRFDRANRSRQDTVRSVNEELRDQCQISRLDWILQSVLRTF